MTTALYLLLHLSLWVLIWILPGVLILCVLFYGLSLPVRRHERARFFLDFLEDSFQHGQNVEQSLVAVSHSRDASLGARLHWLAALLESGLPFPQALQQVPHFLPPRLKEMLRVGGECDRLRQVLPACRQQLGDGVSQAAGAKNYLMLLVLVFLPVAPLLLLVLSIFVFPKFVQILLEMEVPIPAITQFVIDHSLGISLVVLGIALGVYALTVLFVGGPRLSHWIRRLSFGALDWVPCAIPWKRRRLQRDFGAMLAVLLDAGVPEPQAVSLAADCTDNRVFRHRAEKTLNALRSGTPLPEALRHLDNDRGLAWRLRNAGHTPERFSASLQGWLEAQSAKAFQEEQATAHLVTSAFVVFNGGVVGFMIVGIFQTLIAVTEAGVLW